MGANSMFDPLDEPSGEGGDGSPLGEASTGQSLGCTLKQYAAAKRLPIDFLQGLGLSQFSYMGAPAVRIPYRDRDGIDKAVRFRTALKKSEGADNRFRWRSRSRTFLYGLWRLEHTKDSIVLVEGESDCHTLWFHDINAVGLPGAGNWKDSRDAEHLDSFEIIYVVLEPDQGGETVAKWLGKSRIRERARLVRLEGHKDPSELHVADAAGFNQHWQAALDASIPWSEYEAAISDEERKQAWATCNELAREPRILDCLAQDLRKAGMIGEERTTKILYLALTSRLLDRPVSVAVKGPSSGGKSFTCDKVLSFFPSSAYYALTAMSDRALAYSNEPLMHRFLVIYEASGMESDIASYLIRSLLSEGRVRYEFVEKTQDGLQARMIEREGPTGLLVTTTKSGLHPENETRLLSITVADTRDQTRDILLALAEQEAKEVDLTPWHALQEWASQSTARVIIPYAVTLAKAIPPVAVRLRRDFNAILSLIKAYAILHQATRERDTEGRIVATIEDYAAVRSLVADLVAEGVEATVPQTVRETVEAVTVLAGDDGTTKKAVAKRLQIDDAAAWRRCQVALRRGYIQNNEDRRGRPARLVLGDPLPEELVILPDPTTLGVPAPEAGGPQVNPKTTDSKSAEGGDCPVDVRNGSEDTPSPGTNSQRERIVL